MSAIFGFTFHIGRMTEVLTPDIQLIQKRLSFKKVVLQTLSAHEMLGNFYLEPKTQEFYIVTIPGHIINTDSV